MYECITYNYGCGIFNIDNMIKRYRQGVIETNRFYCDDNNISNIDELKNKYPTVIFKK